MEEKTQKISETIAGEMKSRELNIDKLSQLTGVSDRYLKSLISGDFKKLPATPYVRGYLTKIAAVLDLDGEVLWRDFLEENGAGRHTWASAKDEMPKNRFRKRTFWYKTAVFFIVSVLAGIFIFYRFFMVDRPNFSFSSPSEDGARFGTETIVVRGAVDPMYKLVFGGEQVLVLPGYRTRGNDETGNSEGK